MDVIDGTRLLPAMGDAIVEAERSSARAKPALPTKVRILSCVKEHSNESKPLTVPDIQKFMPDVAVNTIAACLSNLCMKERHLFRQRVPSNTKNKRGHRQSHFAYWWNERYTNDTFGKRRLTRSTSTPASEPAPQPKPRPEPVSAPNLSLAEAVRIVNARKEQLGDGMKISLKPGGGIRVTLHEEFE